MKINYTETPTKKSFCKNKHRFFLLPQSHCISITFDNKEISQNFPKSENQVRLEIYLAYARHDESQQALSLSREVSSTAQHQELLHSNQHNLKLHQFFEQPVAMGL